MDEWENKFKRAAEAFQLKPSEAIWEKIEVKLNNREKRKKRFFIFLCLGLFTGVLIAFYLTPDKAILLKHDSENILSNAIQKQENPKSESRLIVNPGSEKINQLNSSSTQKNVSLRSSRDARNRTTVGIKSESGSGDEYYTVQRKPDQREKIVDKEFIQEKNQSNQYKSIRERSFISENNLNYSGFKHSIKEELNSFPDSACIFKAHQSNIAHWSMSLEIAACMNQFEWNGSPDHVQIEKYRMENDRKKMTWNTRLGIHRSLSLHWTISSGIGTVSFGENLSNKQRIQKKVSFLSGPIPVDSVVASTQLLDSDSTGYSGNQWTYLEIPLGLSYSIMPAHKIYFSLGAELAWNFILINKGFVYDQQVHGYRTSDSKDFEQNLKSGLAKFDIHYRIPSRLELVVSPAFRKYFGNVYVSSLPVHQAASQFEVRFGINYFFN